MVSMIFVSPSTKYTENITSSTPSPTANSYVRYRDETNKPKLKKKQ